MKITRKGIPTDIEGTQPIVGALAPSFELINLEGEIISLNSLKGSVSLISVFPDINTRICDLQTRHFFNVAKDYEGVRIVNVSNNTPGQLKNWCAVDGIDAEMLSDSTLSFAKAYGLWIPEFEVLARSIFVIDADGKLIYSEIVPEMAQEPNYQAALDASKNAN